MLDPEAVIVKGGVLALAAFAVIRIVWYEFNKLVSDFRRKRRHH
jgi:predicted outer membrane lipoprotein